MSRLFRNSERSVLAVIGALTIGSWFGTSDASAQQLSYITDKWILMGGESGLGRQTRPDMVDSGGGHVACYERGAITWHPDIGAAYAVYGAIYETSIWSKTCRDGRFYPEEFATETVPSYGYPTMDETTVNWPTMKPVCPGGRLQSFRGLIDNAMVCWTPETGAVWSFNPWSNL